jgi:hypothetical protein
VVNEKGDETLQTNIVWVPVLDGDARSAADTQANLLQTQGVTHQWDGNGDVGPRFARSLSLSGTRGGMCPLECIAAEQGDSGEFAADASPLPDTDHPQGKSPRRCFIAHGAD